MTDNEIIKALERMSEEDPAGFSSDVLDLINRQKAEIERLNETKDEWKLSAINKARRVDELTNEIAKLKFSSMIGATRAEAIKEFAERLHKIFSQCQREYRDVLNSDGACAMIIAREVVNNLVKEMTEGV